jgi:antitoxin CcdA
MEQSHIRKPANLSLDSHLLAEAKALKVNLSRAAEEGIRAAVVRSKSELWQAENRDALESSNEFVERDGLPLGHLRQF